MAVGGLLKKKVLCIIQMRALTSLNFLGRLTIRVSYDEDRTNND